VAVPSDDRLLDEIAHRGSSFGMPENTLAAVQAAVDARVDMVEIDVHRSMDGELVVLHDTSLRRTTDVEEVFPDRPSYNVGELTLAEIRQLDAGSWKGEEFAGEPVPTLQEVVDLVRRSGSGLLVEIKVPHLYPGIAQDLGKVLLAQRGYVTTGVAHERLVVQSFDWGFMAEFDALLPEVPAGLLGTPTIAELPELATWAEQVNPHHATLTQQYVDAVHGHGMDLTTWTVDDPAAMRRLIDLGVDGIITNRPDMLAAVVGRAP
jgi:glycerophosphoryl diester phosphodiesterase